MPSPARRKVHEKPKPYVRKPCNRITPAAHSNGSSTEPVQLNKRRNLTLHDWMTIFKFMDQHPSMAQTETVKHFGSKADGALIFTQGTLSRKVKQRPKLEECVDSHPTALSSKRPRAVTRPDVEKALAMWVKKMEERGESVNGHMLQAKWAKFEEEFDVPDNERLPGLGWISSFCKAYGLKGHRRHGEAGSVDPAKVEAERKRIGAILASYRPCDRWNFDETGLFAL